jgi:hypothetical protein
MALDTFVQLSYTLQDRFGTKASVMLPFLVDQAVIGISDLQDMWLSGGTSLDTCLDAKIVSGRVLLDQVLDLAWKAEPGDESFVERSCVIGFKNLQTKYIFSFAFPSWRNDLIVAGKPDITSPDPFDLIDFITGNGSGTYNGCDLQKHILVATTDAYLATRKKRRQLDRSSFEPGG